VNAGDDTIHNIGGIAGFNGWDTYNPDSPHYNQAYQPGGLIYQCRNMGTVAGGFNKIGGIAGDNAYQITECVNAGNIICLKRTAGWPGVGGIAGRNGNNNTATEQGHILNSYNRGAVVDQTGAGTSHNSYGGITGWCNNTSDVISCYTVGDLTPASGEKNPIIGTADSTPPERGVNNYSLEGIYANDKGNTVYTGVVEPQAYMQSQAFVDALNRGAAGPYVFVSSYYPKLSWE
jgi:hypothetical protein